MAEPVNQTPGDPPRIESFMSPQLRAGSPLDPPLRADVSLSHFVVTRSGELHVPACKLMQLPPLRTLDARSFLYFDRRYVHKDVRAS